MRIEVVVGLEILRIKIIDVYLYIGMI